jgi:peptidoglycan/xylan/chitin deacetylase (PgdA/CDA1 family)
MYCGRLGQWIGILHKTLNKMYLISLKSIYRNGSIVLIHDYGKPIDKLKAIEKTLIYGKSKNYAFVTLSDL